MLKNSIIVIVIILIGLLFYMWKYDFSKNNFILKNPGNDLEFGISHVPDILDPSNIKTISEWTLLGNITNSLLSDSFEGSLAPSIASSWVIDSKSKSVHFTIDQFARFSNGEKITSHDVEATFAFLCQKKGTTKLFLADIIDCNPKNKLEDFTLKSFKIADDYNFTITFLTAPQGVLPILSVPDFGIIPKNNLINSNVNESLNNWSLWQVTSGKFYIEKKIGQQVFLKKSPYNLNNASSNKIENINNIKVTTIPKTLNPIDWVTHGSNRITRLSVIDKQKLESQSKNIKILQGGKFWERIAFFGNGETYSSNEDRHCLKNILRKIVSDIEPDIQLEIRNFGNPLKFSPFVPITDDALELCKKNLAHNEFNKTLKNKNLKLIGSTSTFNATDKEKFEKKLVEILPDAKIFWEPDPAAVISQVKQGHYDMAILLYSYGPQDVYPSLNYYGSYYFNNDFLSGYKLLVDSVLHANSTSKRNNILNQIGDLLENETRLISLGNLPSLFVFSNNIIADPVKLISGEFNFSAFKLIE